MQRLAASGGAFPVQRRDQIQLAGIGKLLAKSRKPLNKSSPEPAPGAIVGVLRNSERPARGRADRKECRDERKACITAIHAVAGCTRLAPDAPNPRRAR